MILGWVWGCSGKYQIFSDCHFRRSLFIYNSTFSYKHVVAGVSVFPHHRQETEALRLGVELESELKSLETDVLQGLPAGTEAEHKPGPWP